MVDLTQRGEDRKKQRAFHMSDATHARLQRAAELSNSTMSSVLDRLIWEDLRLPGDPEQLALDVAPVAPLQEDEPEQPQPTGRAAKIAERRKNAEPNLDDPKSPDALNRRAMERLRKQGHYATRDDGSDQRERDPGIVDKPKQGGDAFDI